MGAKRPEQYRIDVAESGATGDKNRIEDEGIASLEKQELASNRERPEERARRNKIPESGENPAQARLKAKKAQRKRGKS